MAGQLPPLINLSVTPGTESTEVTRIYGDDYSDRLGGDWTSGIAFGDINGDGYDDLVMGAYHADGPEIFDVGETTILYGGPSLPGSSEIALSEEVGFHGETRIYSENQSDWSGAAVATGDVNGDGCDDVIIGAWGGGYGDFVTVGETFIVYGSTSLPASAVVDLSDPPGTHGETRIYGGGEDDTLGWEVSSGDLNGDGYAEVLMSASHADRNGEENAGEVVVIYGNSTLSASAEIDLALPVGAHGETRILGTRDSIYLGTEMATGDVNGDGFDDLILGVPGWSVPGSARVGMLAVLYGYSSISASAEINLYTPPATPGQTAWIGTDEWGYASNSVTAGDVDGDGFCDIIFGDTRSDKGGVSLIYGQATLSDLSTIQLDSIPVSYEFTHITGQNWLGEVVFTGDVNGDGLSDVLMGEPYWDLVLGDNQGRVAVIYGDPSLSASAEIDLVNSEPDVGVVGSQKEALFCYGNDAGGDVDRDGFADFAGSEKRGVNAFTGESTGTVYMIYGDGPSQSATTSLFTRSGDGVGGDITPATDFGPVVRCVVDFSDEDNASTSRTTVVLNRDFPDEAVGQMASVHWQIITEREGWASAEVTFQYTDGEIAGLVEETLVVMHASDATDSFSALPTEIDLRRNEVRVTVDQMGFFALGGADLSPGAAGFSLR